MDLCRHGCLGPNAEECFDERGKLQAIDADAITNNVRRGGTVRHDHMRRLKLNIAVDRTLRLLRDVFRQHVRDEEILRKLARKFDAIEFLCSARRIDDVKMEKIDTTV